MAYEQQKRDFSEQNAERHSFVELPRLHTKQLTRLFKSFNKLTQAEDAAYLNAFVSAKNASPLSYIDNPQANGHGTTPGGDPLNPYPGRWRHVGTNWNERIQRFVQVLRFGWAEQVLDASLPNDECQIATASDKRADDRVLNLVWRSIADTAVKSCMDELRSVGAFTGPEIQGKVHTGRWIVGEIAPQQSQDDGSYVIACSITRVAVINSADDLKGLTPICQRVRDIENPFGLEGGYNAHGGVKPREGLSCTYRNLDMASKVILEALSDAEAQGLLSTEDGLKFEFVKKELQEDAGNTLQLVLRYAWIPLATSAPEESARLVEFKLHNQSGKVHLTRSFPRLTETAAHNELEGGPGSNPKIRASVVTDPIAVGADGVSRTYTGDWLAIETPGLETDDDGMRIVQQLVKAGDQAVDVVLGPDPDHKSYEFYRWDASKVLIDAFLASSDPFGNGSLDPKWSTSEVGITKIVKVEANADRSLNLYAAYLTTADLEHADLAPVVNGYPDGTPLTVGDSYFSRSERGFGYNVPVSLIKRFSDYYDPRDGNEDPAPVVNVKRSFRITRRNEFTFDFEGVIEILYPKETPEFIAEASEAKTILRKAGEHLTAAELANLAYEPPASLVEGDIVRIQRELEESGGVKAVRDTITPNKLDTNVDVGTDPVVSTPFVAKLDSDGTTVRRRIVNAKEADIPTVASLKIDGNQAPIIEQDIQRDPETGLRSIVQTGKVESDQTVTDYEATVQESSSTVKHSATGTAATIANGHPAQNEVIIAQNTPTPGGKKQTVLKTVTKVPWAMPTTAGQNPPDPTTIEKDALLTKSIRLLKNQTSIPAASSAGESVQNPRDNGAGGIDAEFVKKALASGLDSETDFSYAKTPDWDIGEQFVKIPIEILGTPGVATYLMRYGSVRSVKVEVTRKYSLSYPSIDLVDYQNKYDAGDSYATIGSGVSITVQIIPIGDGVWCKEIKKITTDAYSDLYVQWKYVNHYLNGTTPS